MPRGPSPVEIVAHRGASAHAPEHTLAAYDLALALGADALELDLRTTADGELVVLHDPTLWRTARDPRTIADLDAADLAALPGPSRPLALTTVLERYGAWTRLVLELKDPTPAMERQLVATLAAARVRDPVVQSFDEVALRRLRALDSRLPVAPLRATAPARRGAWLDRMAALGAVAVGVHHAQVDAALVSAAHRRGLRVRAWTVNDADEAARLAAADVDGVITDVPGQLRAAVAEPLAAPALAA